MVTLAVATVLAMIAVPNFRHMMVSMHLSDLNSALSGDLQYARIEAVSRQVNVAVAASAGSWENGWIVSAAPASTSPTAPWTVLRRHAGASAMYAIAASPATPVQYQPQGTLTSPAACFALSAPETGNTPIFLQVLASGMVQTTAGTASAPSPSCPSPP